MTINPGAHVLVRTADGRELPRRAVSGVVDGQDFPVVWITTEEKWQSVAGSEGQPEAWPWPAEDVQAHNGAVAA